MIEGLGLYQVLSYFTRTSSTDSVDTTVHVRYINEGGHTKIEEVIFRSYNANGEQITTPVTHGSKVDITV